MSSKYAESTIGRLAVARPRRRTGLLGLGAVLAGVTAVGAAVAVFLAPAQAPAVPLTPWTVAVEDPSTAPPERRPALSISTAPPWAVVPPEDPSTAPPERRPGPPLGAPPPSAVDPGDPESSAGNPGAAVAGR